ncbi:hypothetical protein BMS3Bbin02_00774 [bacterium BMS3Bbin02]|nr:hypothetical protein BMS3Bbin02_00774 [bacterium BMS3Bbin02]
MSAPKEQPPRESLRHQVPQHRNTSGEQTLVRLTEGESRMTGENSQVRATERGEQRPAFEVAHQEITQCH